MKREQGVCNKGRCGKGSVLAVILLSALLLAVTAGTETEAGEPVFCPQAVTEGPDGSLLVTDCYSRVIWKVQGEKRGIYAGKPGPEGLYGKPEGGYEDGTLREMRMDSPWDIVPFMDGYAVTDQGNHVVRYMNAKGSRTLAGSGSAGYEDNIGGKAAFSHPSGLAAGPDGQLYIADTGNDVVRVLGPEGKVDTFLRGLSGPTGLCWYDGCLYVADTGNHRILKVRDGSIVWTAGKEEGWTDGSMEQARFSSPGYLAAAEDGTIYLSDTGNGTVRGIRDGQVFTPEWSREPYPSMELLKPAGLMAWEGGLYVCDSFSRKLFVLTR